MIVPINGPTILLHQTQIDFLACNELFAAFVGGIGSGKSFVLCYDAMRRAKRKRLYMMVAPTYPMLRDATQRSFFGLADQLKVPILFHKSENRVEFKRTGAELLFRSADSPETLRATNLSGVYLDEASLVHRDVYDILIGRLRQNGRMGFLRAGFTPKGRYHWSYEVFAKPTLDGNRVSNTALFHCKTSDNPFNPPEFATTLAQQYTEIFGRQELGGEFLDIEGAEWGHEYFPESIWFDEYPVGLYHAVCSLDPSKGPNDKAPKRAGQTRESDYSAIVGTARDKHGVLWCEADLARRDVNRMMIDSVAFARRFIAKVEDGGTNCDLEAFGIEGDAWQDLLAKPFTDASLNAGFPMHPHIVRTGGVPKEVRIRRLTPLLVQSKLRFRRTPGTRLLVQQMQQFPIGEHDDGPDSLEINVRLGDKLFSGKYGRVA